MTSINIDIPIDNEWFRFLCPYTTCLYSDTKISTVNECLDATCCICPVLCFDTFCCLFCCCSCWIGRDGPVKLPK